MGINGKVIKFPIQKWPIFFCLWNKYGYFCVQQSSKLNWDLREEGNFLGLNKKMSDVVVVNRIYGGYCGIGKLNPNNFDVKILSYTLQLFELFQFLHSSNPQKDVKKALKIGIWA